MNYIIIGQLNNGEVEKFEKYLSLKKKSFLSVGFDNYLQKKNKIKIETFENGTSTKKKYYTFFYFRSENKIITLINFLILFFSIIFKIKKYENAIGIGISLFPTVICHFLKIRNKIKNYVYYNQDYYLPEKNLSSIIFCKIFSILDNFLYLNCIKAWNSSIRLDDYRKKIPIKDKIGKTLIVTNGFFNNFDETEKYNPDSNEITFVGTLSENQKIEELIDIVKLLNQKNYKIKLNIIGSGQLLDKIKSKIKYENLENIVNIFGFIEDLFLLRKIISKSLLCYCVYRNNELDNSSIASVGKLTLYTSIRRPSILSDHLVLSKYYKRYECGLLTNSKNKDILSKIELFLKEKNLRIQMQKNLNKIRPIWITERRYNRAFKSLEGF